MNFSGPFQSLVDLVLKFCSIIVGLCRNTLHLISHFYSYFKALFNVDVIKLSLFFKFNFHYSNLKFSFADHAIASISLSIF